MAMYFVAYDAHAERDDARIKAALAPLGIPILKSTWLVEYKGSAAQLCEALSARLQSRDALAIMQIVPNADWSVFNEAKGAHAWLRSRIHL